MVFRTIESATDAIGVHEDDKEADSFGGNASLDPVNIVRKRLAATTNKSGIVWAEYRSGSKADPCGETRGLIDGITLTVFAEPALLVIRVYLAWFFCLPLQVLAPSFVGLQRQLLALLDCFRLAACYFPNLSTQRTFWDFPGMVNNYCQTGTINLDFSVILRTQKTNCSF